MPRKPLKLCKHPGCPELTENRFVKNIEIFIKKSANARGYDSRWKI